MDTAAQSIKAVSPKVNEYTFGEDKSVKIEYTFGEDKSVKIDFDPFLKRSHH